MGQLGVRPELANARRASKFRAVALDPKIRTGLAKEGRLWILGLLCAVPGAFVAERTQDWWAGAVVFLGCFVVLGPLLWIYERRKKRAAEAARNPQTNRGQNPPQTSKPSVSQQHGQQKRNKPGPDGRGR